MSLAALIEKNIWVLDTGFIDKVTSYDDPKDDEYDRYIEYSAYEQLKNERDELQKSYDELYSTHANWINSGDLRQLRDLKSDRQILLEALENECCCAGERGYYPPYKEILCDACEALAKVKRD